MVSEVYKICHAYESGFGHGVKNDGHSSGSYGGEGSDKLNEAYAIGYQEGFRRWEDAQKEPWMFNNDGIGRSRKGSLSGVLLMVRRPDGMPIGMWSKVAANFVEVLNQ